MPHTIYYNIHTTHKLIHILQEHVHRNELQGNFLYLHLQWLLVLLQSLQPQLTSTSQFFSAEPFFVQTGS